MASKAEQLLESLRGASLSIVVAESLTGGMLASELASISGASDVFLGGVVAYSNAVKQNLLGVSPQSLETIGAVSEDVALQMAQGAQERFATACGLSRDRVVSVATTGVAGPADSQGKTVGTVFIAALIAERSIVRGFHLDGDRQRIREATCREAFALVAELLASKD